MHLGAQGSRLRGDVSFPEPHSLSMAEHQQPRSAYQAFSLSSHHLAPAAAGAMFPREAILTLAVAVVAEDTFLKTVQGHEADMLTHVKGDL